MIILPPSLYWRVLVFVNRSVVYLNRKSEIGVKPGGSVCGGPKPRTRTTRSLTPHKLNAQEPRRVLYPPSCIVASRYWSLLVLTGCLFKSEIGNRKSSTSTAHATLCVVGAGRRRRGARRVCSAGRVRRLCRGGRRRGRSAADSLAASGRAVTL